MTKPSKPERSKLIKLWLTEDEMKLLRIAAAFEGLAAPTFARKAILEQAAKSEALYFVERSKKTKTTKDQDQT